MFSADVVLLFLRCKSDIRGFIVSVEAFRLLFFLDLNSHSKREFVAERMGGGGRRVQSRVRHVDGCDISGDCWSMFTAAHVS